MDEPTWISDELVAAVHDRQIAEHGGTPGVRDEGLLESALARPKQKWAYGGEQVGIVVLAAAYAFGIARNHPFSDGNKRTAAVICELFLELNGYTLTASDGDLYPVFMALAAGEMSEEGLVEWLGTCARPDAVNEVAGGYRTS